MPTNPDEGRPVPTVGEASPEYLNKEGLKASREAFMHDFGDRVARLRGRATVPSIAAAVGVHRNTIWNIERGQSLPDVYELLLLAKALRTTVPALLGISDTGNTMLAEKSSKAVNLDNFVYVPHFDIRVSAGNGSFQDVGHVTTMRPFDSAYIRGELGITHDDVGLCDVIGNSGEPVLHSRDTVLVDFRDRSVMIEGLHIVRLDGLPMLKKLQRLPGKMIRVSSSNSEEYAPFDISGDEDSQRDFEVIGRVRWAGVTFR